MRKQVWICQCGRPEETHRLLIQFALACQLQEELAQLWAALPHAQLQEAKPELKNASRESDCCSSVEISKVIKGFLQMDK